jgi:hypothetical protein
MAGTMMEAEDWGQEVSWPPRGHENWESSQETYLYADHDGRFSGAWVLGSPLVSQSPCPFYLITFVSLGPSQKMRTDSTQTPVWVTLFCSDTNLRREALTSKIWKDPKPLHWKGPGVWRRSEGVG